MANIFKSTREIVQEMCDDFKSITEITLTPDNFDDTNVIKFWSWAGVLSSFYSQAQRNLNDFFPTSASEEALRKHLSTRSLASQIQATPSHGQIEFTLTDAAEIPLDTQVRRRSNGALYKAISTDSLVGAGTLTLFFESIDPGNDQNIDATDEPFELVTPIENVTTACESTTIFADGRDLETASEMLARIIEHDQDDNTGGNAAAYEAWAKAASNEVVTAKCLRLVRGPDTVDLIITSGTTDIEAAVDAGDVVSRLPSVDLIAEVQEYVEELNPVTDDVLVLAPTEEDFDSTVKYTLYDESAANRAYADDLITKVWKTYVYQARAGDRLSPTDLERLIDKKLGDLLKEREVENFAGGTTYYDVPTGKILNPDTLTLDEL